MRDYRRRKRIEKLAETESELQPIDNLQSSKPIGSQLHQWTLENLKVPHGHANAGMPMELPEYAVEFLNDAMDHRESLLSVGRKNAKSAIIACYLIARLIGSIRIKGYRGGVCSVSREKAGELFLQCSDICKASNIDTITFRQSPKHMISPSGTVDFLSADRSAGHASGFDDAICDELGLLQERDRTLVNGLRSSVSARNGRFIAISILGDSPLTREMLDRKHLDTTCVHLYQSNEQCSINDEEAWYESNPTLGSIKSLEYMRDEANRCMFSPADERAFRAFDLNQPYSATREMICDLTSYRNNCTDTPMPRSDRCVIGVDLGGSNSMTAAVIGYLGTGRVETYAAFGGNPPLSMRGSADGVGGLYDLMQDRGELRVYEGYRVTPVEAFIQDVFDQLGKVEIVALGADRYRAAEMVQALERIHRKPPIVWRGVGAGQYADGSYDVRAFQRAILNATFSMRESLAWANAITESSIRYDHGNPALDKKRHHSRIDILQAAVIMAGLYERAEQTKNEIQFELVG